MREVNFSIPNVNKASVYITATLYDRRALDCTSTLPLINSLNHLAYLTTSSARIRDILTVDGGVERLVCILKEGRSKDEMHMWKWNLAFQCIVNIGVRGSENVRTRVVEADMVPVIATILFDYVLVIDRERSKVDNEEAKRKPKIKAGPQSARFPPRDFAAESASRTSFFEHQHSENRPARRQAPPPSLSISQSFTQRMDSGEETPTEAGPAAPSILTSPPERTTFSRPLLSQHRSHEGRTQFSRSIAPGPATAVPSTDTSDVFALRPVRDVDRLPSMLPPLHSGVPSNPESPTTPHAPLNQRNIVAPVERRMRRPSIRHQLSTSGDSDDAIMEDANPVNETTEVEQNTRLGNGRSTPQVVGIVDREPEIHDEPDHLTINIPENIPQGEDNVDIAQQTPTAANAMDGIVPVNDEETGNSPAVTAQQQTASPAPPLSFANSMLLRNTFPNGTAIPLMPRDDDVLMGLQLLAYISKYCDLRHYFQATHLVPRLRIDREVEKIFGPAPGCEPIPEPEEDEDEEYLQSEDYNIFPLVEKFTQPHYSKDMQYWACVVMRNLCRKDDAKGGIRQCANYTCGKWEEFPRQFAKCRRCRRTKYCSKDCQRISWSMHRHWCQTP